MAGMSLIRVARLGVADRETARRLFLLMAGVFETEAESLSDGYIDGLLERPGFWALAATVDEELAGGLTAHTLPLTRMEVAEVFIYDVAVLDRFQRRGVGRALMRSIRELAGAEGIRIAFTAAHNEDEHALDFYQAVGGTAEPVTIYTFGEDEP
jgi:aminoglycoside 3-N-acetyltransferase I